MIKRMARKPMPQLLKSPSSPLDLAQSHSSNRLQAVCSETLPLLEAACLEMQLPRLAAPSLDRITHSVEDLCSAKRKMVRPQLLLCLEGKPLVSLFSTPRTLSSEANLTSSPRSQRRRARRATALARVVTAHLLMLQRMSHHRLP